MMKILHAPTEIAGQMGIISRAQRELGHESISVAYHDSWLGYTCDINLHLKNNFLYDHQKIMMFFLRNFNRYSIYHFHFCNSLLPKNIDLPILKSLGKKIIFHFWGGDIRRKINVDGMEENAEDDGDRNTKKKIKRLLSFSNGAIVATPDLLSYVPNSQYVPIAIYSSELPLPQTDIHKKGRALRILHAPTNRGLKGTKHVLPVIERLKNEGHEIELILVEKIPHDQIYQYIQQADIVLDQFLVGWYGLLSAEAMAMRKPVMCYIRDDLKGYCPGLPILNTNTENIYNNLKLLIENPDLRNELGEKGRRYVEEMHDAIKIARQLISCYEDL